MKQFVKAFLFLLLFATSGNAAMADEKANIVKQGTVRGRIIDVTKQTLPGASIYIEKLHTGVTSDVNGFYTFPNLDPGTYTVKVSYVGYSPVELKITIPAGRTLEKDVVLAYLIVVDICFAIFALFPCKLGVVRPGRRVLVGGRYHQS